MSKEVFETSAASNLGKIVGSNPEMGEMLAQRNLDKDPNDLESKYWLAIALGEQKIVSEALAHGKELYEADQDTYRVTYALLLGLANRLDRFDLIEEHQKLFNRSDISDPEMEENFEKALTPIEDDPFKLLKSKGATTVYSGFDDPEIVDRNCASHQEGSSRIDTCDSEDDRDFYPDLSL